MRQTPVYFTLPELRWLSFAVGQLLTDARNDAFRTELAQLHSRLYDLVDILVDLEPKP